MTDGLSQAFALGLSENGQLLFVRTKRKRRLFDVVGVGGGLRITVQCDRDGLERVRAMAASVERHAAEALETL